VQGIGKALRQAREAEGLSVAEMYRRTHIREWIVEAIEAENYAAIPGGPAYLRGFVRRLCVELNLDLVELSQGVELEGRENRPPLTKTTPGRQLNRASLAGVVLMCCAFSLAALYWFFGLPNTPKPPVANLPPVDPPQVVTPITPPTPPLVEQPTFVFAGVLDGRHVFVVKEWPVQLKVAVREEQCWVMVEVDGAGGRSAMLQAGESREFTANLSLRLRLGRARVADIIVNGHSLPGQTGDVMDFTFTKAGP